MCRIMEEVKLEGIAKGIAQERARVKEAAEQKAVRMLRDGKLPLNEIADYTDFSLEEIRQLAVQARQ